MQLFNDQRNSENLPRFGQTDDNHLQVDQPLRGAATEHRSEGTLCRQAKLEQATNF